MKEAMNKLKKAAKKAVWYGALCIPPIAGTLYGLATKTDVFDGKPIVTEAYVHGKIQRIEAPNPNFIKLKPLNCTKYARVSAETIYGLKYTPADAWNMKYHNKVIAKVKGWSDLEELAKKNMISPGSLVGIYNRHSKYLKDTDEKGLPRNYTHMAVYVGSDSNEKPLFLHQFGKNEGFASLEELWKKHDLEPRDVLMPEDIQ